MVESQFTKNHVGFVSLWIYIYIYIYVQRTDEENTIYLVLRVLCYQSSAK